ncbi:MAG: hypothetical protein IJF96_03055 [Firmicutes bacterium]|nr:hypothetical protein [Bacillota bacterium]
MGTGTDPAILITLIVIAVLVLVAIIVFKSKAEKQTGSLKNIEEKLDAMEQGEATETKQPEGAAQTVAETGTVEPETAAETSEPEAAEDTVAEAADTGTAEVEAAETETVEAEAAEPEVADVETAEPETEGAETTEAESAEPESLGDDDIFNTDNLTISEIGPLDDTDLEAEETTAQGIAAESAETVEEIVAEEPAAETVETEAAEMAVTPEGQDDSLIKNYNTGRSGHSYSKEELEAQIRI